MGFVHPTLLFFLGAVLAAVLRGTPRKIALVAIPLLAFLSVHAMEPGTSGAVAYLGFDLAGSCTWPVPWG
jgi:multicomponent Na+:H+ antiporter subunit D